MGSGGGLNTESCPHGGINGLYKERQASIILFWWSTLKLGRAWGLKEQDLLLCGTGAFVKQDITLELRRDKSVGVVGLWGAFAWWGHSSNHGLRSGGGPGVKKQHCGPLWTGTRALRERMPLPWSLEVGWTGVRGGGEGSKHRLNRLYRSVRCTTGLQRVS